MIHRFQKEWGAFLGKRIQLEEKNHTYQIFDKEKQLFEGSWEIRNDSLILYRDFILRHEVIDSIVYHAEGASNQVTYYKDGKEVAYQGPAGILSPRAYESFCPRKR